MGLCLSSSSEEEGETIRVPGEKEDVRKNRPFILPEHIDESYRPTQYEKSETSKTLIRKALQNSQVFSGLQDVEGIVSSMKECRVAEGETLIKQGDPGDAFYVVESGSLDVLVDGRKEARSGAGGTFGELALIMNQPRAASVVAVEPCVCWKIDRKPFRYFLASADRTLIDQAYEDLKAVKILKDLPSAHLYKLAAHVSKESFEEGATIIKKGDEGDKFFMIKDGVVECLVSEASHVELSAGSHFGDRALNHQQPRACDVVAKTRVETMALSKNDFEALLGPVSEAIEKTNVVNAIRGLKGEEHQEDEKHELYDLLVKKKLKAGSKRSMNKSLFCYIQSGTLVLCDDTGRRLSEGEFFEGSATVKAESDVLYYSLSTSPAKKKKEPHAKAAAFDEKYTKLKLGRTLGTGTFGRVRIATHGSEVYAVKQLVKKAMVEMNQAESVELERKILYLLDHPFVLKCYASFQTRDVCYFVLEFIQAGELFSRVEGGVDPPEAAFHAACVVDAFEHIHSHHILYRDLKPENVLLDDRGYARIVDFGFAKKLGVDKNKTYTILGTPEYLSPECVRGKGYGFDVDLWAFGVLTFEMLTGRSPFCAKNPDDTLAIFGNIINGQVNFPRKGVPEAAKSFVLSLLKRNMTKRLGAQRGAAGIKTHVFLEKYSEDYAKLRLRQLVSPFQPKLKGTADASRFDRYPEQNHKKIPTCSDNSPFVEFGPMIENPFSAK